MKLQDLPYLSTKRLDALASAGIHTPLDLLSYFPRKYIDRRAVRSISSLPGRGEEVTVAGEVQKILHTGPHKNKRLEVYINDGTGLLKAVWFKGTRYVGKNFKKGDRVAFFGSVKRYGRYLSIAHPDFEKLTSDKDLEKMASILPVYPATKGFSKTRITNGLFQTWIELVLKHEDINEFLPQKLLETLNIPERYRAFYMIHQPEKNSDWQQAAYRFKFEEFFLFQLGLHHIKGKIITRTEGPVFSDFKPFTAAFFNQHLPFSLTEGQKNALGDIKKDVRAGQQMNRLLQGDVGSGKTVVATGAMLMAVDNGYQAALMAPTEILAEQHYRTLSNFLEPFDITIRLLTGRQKTALRRDVLSTIAGGQCDIVVGTHAIIQKTVDFYKLGLVVVDEQHRFGVAQRAEILKKGTHPHLLVMSATPIPRSLAMTLYGDLDISLIKELPAGRKPIITAVRDNGAREDVYNFIEGKLAEGGQAYMVYPLVEESEVLDLKDATLGYEKICKRFDIYNVGLLHGKMDSIEKDEVMRAFIAHELDILVSTTVIEVGVDVPNANIMLIEHAERFGLSQLHQLRGRVGRGDQHSYCILMAGEQIGHNGWQRLRTLENSNSGFYVAEVDLKMRGPGNFLGTQQSGLPNFKFADIVEDQSILERAKIMAQQLLDDDPTLKKPRHRPLRDQLDLYLEDKEQYFNLI